MFLIPISTNEAEGCIKESLASKSRIYEIFTNDTNSNNSGVAVSKSVKNATVKNEINETSKTNFEETTCTRKSFLHIFLPSM